MTCGQSVSPNRSRRAARDGHGRRRAAGVGDVAGVPVVVRHLLNRRRVRNAYGAGSRWWTTTAAITNAASGQSPYTSHEPAIVVG